ncbi:Rhodanese-like domain-containing protein [Radiomyces spectabilis]|uniref:Rhodanese-like domain-containing protein n=1 Tax=Radiomyces spectabilis TaxID=64574 RepID=UPI0022200237|nr:Rhodanese-like domain-containing protein [Radiomyces spectabilis]KAI8391369.1 Rhodanese-like domain-containing protein [Radiomyces spectabilis]
MNVLSPPELDEWIARYNYSRDAWAGHLTLVDVREQHEIENQGQIYDSIHIPWGLAEHDSNALVARFLVHNKEIPLIIYCRSGRRSRLAAAKAIELGFKNVYDLQGGILNWIENNLPVQSDTQASVALG